MPLENRKKKKKIHTKKKNIKKFVYLTPYSHHKQSTTDLICIMKGWEYAYAIKNNGEELI